jgi:GDP-L-fucose synthase
MQTKEGIFVAGHRGLAGGAILHEFQGAGYGNLLTRTHSDLDLTERQGVRAFFAEARPSVVILAAAKVGGIKANNDFPVEFLLQNLKIRTT